MSVRIIDDESGQDLAADTGIEVTMLVAGVRRTQHFASWDEIPWKRIVRRAQDDGALTALIARDMAVPAPRGRPR